MHHAFNPLDFDPDFASPADWACMYRALDLQIVPGKEAVKGGQWKMPALSKWADLQDELTPQSTFERWYGPSGEHINRKNMGIITGRCSGNVFVIDLDDQKGPQAQTWWHGLVEVENHGLDPETVEQRTGGGGRQKLFRAPQEWRAPTNKTSIGVDIRGQVGFAMMPDSLHESGREYEWLPGHAPWETAIASAEQWLLDAVEALVGAYGGDQGSAPHTHTASPKADYDAFGNYIDLRERVMRDVVWHAVLELYRQSPIPPTIEIWLPAAEKAYEVYERKVSSRIIGADKFAGLERERRGVTAFRQKWRATMRHWGSPRMVDDATKPYQARNDGYRDYTDEFARSANNTEVKAKTDSSALFEYLSVDQIKNMVDPNWLVSGLVVEQALGFIYGPPGCLKTFIALDMALSFTVGMPDWWGRIIERHGAVVYISSEGQADLKFRIQAWEQHNKVLADDSPFYLIRQTINFMKTDDVGKLLATVQAIMDQRGKPIAAVFVDTVSRVLPGAEENLQKDMTLFVAACDAVRQRFGATVIGLHHTSRAGNIRGSTVIPGAGDFLVEVRREPGALTGSVFATKIKSAEDGWEQFFKVEKIQLGDIGGNLSLVVRPIDIAPKRESGLEWPDKNICRQILAAIDEQWMVGRPLCFAQNSSRAAVPFIMKRWHLKRDVVADILATWNAECIIAEEVKDAKRHVLGYRKLIEI